MDGEELKEDPKVQTSTPPETSVIPGEGNKKLEAVATILNEGKTQRAPLQNEVTPESLEKSPITLSQIALIGDSIGYGIESRGFSKLEIGKGRQIIPKGGEMVSQIGKELSKVDPTKTPYLIIQGGSNNLNSPKGGWNPENTAEELIKLYRLAIEKGFKKENITLVTIPPHRNTSHLPYADLVTKCNEFLKKKANENGFRIFDLHSACVETMKDPDPKKRFVLPDPKDGIHPSPQGYRVIANILINEMTGIKNDTTTAVETSAQLEAQAQQVEKENPAKAMHMKYLETTEKLNEADAKADEEFIRKSSIKDLRKKSRLLNAKTTTEEKPIEQIINLKDETARRLRAYTSTRDNQWYTINYEKFGSDSTGLSHEMNIGLGDILLDNDIEEILVMKASGEMIKGHKQLIADGQHKGRVGYADENGQYIATYTGDKFRILSDKEVDIKNASEVTTYVAKLQEYNNTREKTEIYTETNINRRGSRIGIENARRILELKKEVRLKDPNISEKDLYLQVSAIAETKAKETSDDNERIQWQIIANDCKDTANVVSQFPDFDLNLYKRKIMAAESGGNYKARNDDLGRKKGVNPSRWAFGKYQFLSPTAASYGAKFDPENEEEIQAFLNDHIKQEDVMNAFTLANLRIYSRLPESKKREFTEAGIDIYKILGAMHFGGAGMLKKSLDEIRNAKDWIATSTNSGKTFEKSYWKHMDEVQPLSEKEENMTAKGDIITVPEFDKYNKKIVSTLRGGGQENWVIGSSSGVTISSKTRNIPDMGAFGINGAGPKEVFETIENIVANLNTNDLPKKVTLVGMGVNGLSPNGNTEKTVDYNIGYYMRIAKLFESKGVTVKISPLQIAPSKETQIIAFNNELRNNPEYSKYCIETGVDRFYANHPTNKGYQDMINRIQSSKLDSESVMTA